MINHESQKTVSHSFDYYELPSIPETTIVVAESVVEPDRYSVGFFEQGRYQSLFEDEFPNKSQAVMLAKDVLK